MWFRSEDDIDSLIARSKYGKAARLLKKKLEEDPENARARQRLGDVLGRCGKTAEAAEVLTPLVEMFAAEGFSNKAIAVVKKIQRLDPENETAAELIKRVRVHSDLARFEAPPLIHSHLDSDTDELQLVTIATDSSDATSELTADWFKSAAVRDDFRWSPVLSRLSGTELVDAVGQLDLLVKNPGAIVYGQGESAPSIFILASGFARCYHRDSSHRYRQVMVFHEGHFFGEEAFFAPEQGRSHTVTAGDECELLEIDLPTLDGIIGAHKGIRDHLEQTYRSRSWNQAN